MRQQGQAAGGLEGGGAGWGYGFVRHFVWSLPGQASCAAFPGVLPGGYTLLTHIHMRLPPQAALAKGEPVQYNKEHPLNPFFVVYGKR